MIIANPIYDVVFKRLMENERIAKFFIGTLLNQTVESVAVRPQEFTYTKELFGLAVFRLDFVAVIRTEEGELKVEKLTHDSYVVQVNRIAGRFKTPLDKLLSVFEQAHFVDEQAIIKDYPYQTDSEELKIMTDILHHSGSDPVTRKEIEDEQEAWRSVNALFEDERKKYQLALEEKEQALEEKNQTLEAQRQLIEELKRKLAGK